MPYSFQPSFKEFKEICKLNELSNDECKYNKILSYFDTDLESLDWDKLNEETWKIRETSGDYKKGIFEYATVTDKKQLNSRAEIIASFLSSKSKINRYNINRMSVGLIWHTKRFLLDDNEGTGIYWDEKTLGCDRITTPNYNPQQRTKIDK